MNEEDRLRELADAGYSRKTVCGMLGISIATLDYRASKYKIAFSRMTKGDRAKSLGPAIAAAYWPKMKAVYRAELAREIAEAKKEMAFAQPYKPPLDRNGEPA